MKSVVKTTSILSGILAVISLVLGLRVMSGGDRIINLAVFFIVASGGIMTFFGNLLSIAVTCGGFGMMAYHGMRSFSSSASRKSALYWGIAMTILCFISIICSIVSGIFNFGDVVLLALPAAYTYSIIATA